MISFVSAASLSGIVKQAQSEEVLSSVLLTLNGTQHITVTNMDGFFEFKGLTAGSYTMSSSYVGFADYTEDFVIEDETNLSIIIELNEEVIALPMAIVRSYSLTGGMQQQMNIPGSAYYLPLRELKRFEFTDPNRILASIPGVQIQEEDGFGLRPNIGFRGSGVERSSKITVMEDGVLAAPAPYSAPAAYYFPTIARMHGVEILKGSSQIEYGPFTTGGALNLISLPIPEGVSGLISSTHGSFDYEKTLIEVGASNARAGIVAQYLNQGSTGFKTLPNQEETGFRKKDFLMKARIQTKTSSNINQILTLKWGHANELSHETYLGLTQNDFKLNPYQRYAGSKLDQMKTTQNQYSIRHAFILPKDLSMTTTAYLHKFSRNWYKLDKVSGQNGEKNSISKILADPFAFERSLSIIKGLTDANGLIVKANNRSYLSRGVQTVLQKIIHTGDTEHILRAGLRFHFDEVDRFQWTDTYKMVGGEMILTQAGIQGTESNRIESAQTFSSFLRYELHTGKVTFHPGLRFENILMDRRDFGKEDPERLGLDLLQRENQTRTWIPGLGIEFDLSQQSNLFTGIHKGFAPPGSQPEAKPESSTNLELGFRWHPKNLNFESILFYTDYQNLLGSDLAASGGMGSTTLFNGGAATTYGIETQLSFTISPASRNAAYNIPIQISYTYTNAFFDSDFESSFEGWKTVQNGDELPYLAKHQLNIQAAIEHPRWSLSIQGNYTSAMRSSAGNGTIPISELIPAIFVTDMSASYAVTQKATLKAGVYNVFNHEYLVALRPAGYRPGLPRIVQAGLHVGL